MWLDDGIRFCDGVFLMNLLLSRDQSHAPFSLVPLRLGFGTVFKLIAELELDEEEKRLLFRYKLSNSVLIEGDGRDTFARAFRSGLFLGILTFVVLWLMAMFVSYRSPLAHGLSYVGMLSWALTVMVVMTFIYYRSLRERLYVTDLTNGGRSFYCDSVVDLIKKEAWLEGVSGYLRQVLVSSKHWDSRETITITPLDKDEAKRVVLRAS